MTPQDRPAAPLARALSCALCHGLLREAMAAVECGHTCGSEGAWVKVAECAGTCCAYGVLWTGLGTANEH